MERQMGVDREDNADEQWGSKESFSWPHKGILHQGGLGNLPSEAELAKFLVPVSVSHQMQLPKRVHSLGWGTFLQLKPCPEGWTATNSADCFPNTGIKMFLSLRGRQGGLWKS